MRSQTSSYKLKRFSSSRDPDFATALLLYVRNTPLNIRTDTDEITYWLDSFLTKFGNPFYVFGFYRDRQLVGYAEAAYFQEERLIALDYIVIDEAHRRNNVFYEFVEHLKLYLEGAHPEYRYAIAEVCYDAEEKAPSRESCLLIRLLKLQGFRIIRAPYYQPRLAHDNAESEVRADLLIYSAPYLNKIRVETFLSIVHTLYYKYYLPWKMVRPGTTTAYKHDLGVLYSKIQAELGRKQIIIINGRQEILSAPSRKPVTMLHRTVAFSLQALGVIILLTAAMLGLKSVFKLSNGSFALVYVLAMASFVAVAGIVSKDARTVFAQIASLAKYAFDRKTDGSKPIGPREEDIEPPDQDAQ
jgi:hypothetical protein